MSWHKIAYPSVCSFCICFFLLSFLLLLVDYLSVFIFGRTSTMCGDHSAWVCAQCTCFSIYISFSFLLSFFSSFIVCYFLHLVYGLLNFRSRSVVYVCIVFFLNSFNFFSMCSNTMQIISQRAVHSIISVSLCLIVTFESLILLLDLFFSWRKKKNEYKIKAVFLWVVFWTIITDKWCFEWVCFCIIYNLL